MTGQPVGGVAVKGFPVARSEARLLVPALMHLFGAANWWLPSWLDRLLPNFAGLRLVR